jgi:hypothetical protein
MAKATDERVTTGAETKGGGGETGHEARETIGEARREAAAKVDDLKQEVKEGARDLRHQAEDRADRWTSQMGGRADSLGRALRAAADKLGEDGERSMADMARDAAGQVERMSGYLEDESPSTMLHDFQELGRRNPAAFVGSAFALGLVAGRFLRASSPDGDGHQRTMS